MLPIVLIGLGNPLFRDEGIGLAVVNAIAAEAEQHPEVEVLDLGTAGLALLHHLAGRRLAVFVDCAFMDAPPGTLRRFAPEDVVSVKTLAGFSLHEGDLLQVLDLARHLHSTADEITLFGIQPADVSPGEGLSPLLQAHLPEYVAHVKAALLA